MSKARLQGRMVFCTDVRKTAEMLEAVLGFEKGEEFGGDISMWGQVVDGERARIEYYLRSAIPSVSDNLGTFVVEDVDGLTLELIAWGCTVVGGPNDTPWGVREAYVRDPDGHEITLRGPLRGDES